MMSNRPPYWKFVIVLSVLACATARAQIHFRFTSNTGNNATVAVPLTANPGIGGVALAAGDEIGAFTPGGLCAGAVVWSGVSTVITVWGDNDQTTTIDGMRGGEQISYRLWQQSTATEFRSVTATYLQGDGSYSANAIDILASLDAVLPPAVPQLVSPPDGVTDQPTTLTVNWNASPGATTYRLQLAATSAFTSPVVDDSTLSGTTRQVGPLTNSATYYWRVSARNSGGTSGWSGTRSFTTIGAAPSAFGLSSPSNGATDQGLSGTLNWQASTGATGYDVYLGETNPPTTLFSSNQPGTSYGYTGLARGTSYYWKVVAWSAGGNTTATGSPWEFTTVPAPPAPPEPVSPANGAADQPTALTVAWNASAGAASYQIQVSGTSTFSSTVIDQSGITTAWYAVSGLVNGTTYYWRVNATNTGGTGGWSATRNFTTIAAAPDAPALVSPANSATDVSTSPTLTWNTAGGATSYHVQVSTAASFSSLAFDQAGLTTASYDLSGLANNRTYYWRVSATNTGGTGNWSSVWKFTTVPQVPPSLSSPPDGATNQPVTLTLSWAPSTGATSYRLQVSTRSDFSTTVVDDSLLTQTSQQVGPLAYSTVYHWRVSDGNPGGAGNWSNAWTFTTSSPGTPPGPDLTSPASGSINQPATLTLSWNAVTGALAYHLQVSSNPAFTAVVVDDSTLTGSSREVGPLENGTTFYWRVQAKSPLVTGNWSSVWDFSIVPAVPAAPSPANPANRAVNQQTTLALTWNPSPAAASYRLEVSADSTFASTVLDQSGIPTTSFTAQGLANNTTYYWRMNASNAGGTSGWSSVWSFATIASVPSPPALVSPANESGNAPQDVSCVWNQSAGAASYELQVSASWLFTSTIVDQNGITATSYTVHGLSPGTTYYWRVRALNAGGRGDWTASWYFTTAAAAPSAPILGSPVNGATGEPASLTLVWNPSPGATGYELQVSGVQDFSTTVYDSSGLTSTSQQVGPLKYNTLYHWRARGTIGSSPTGWSEAWTFSTGVPPYSPTYSLNKTTAFPAYSNTSDYHPSDYRIIGLPGAGNVKVSTLLGGVQDQDWQAYWDNGAPANGIVKFNGGSDFRFTVGRAFWVIRKGTWRINTTVPSAPMNPAQQVEIPLHPGWNLITNPFSSSIAWSQIQSNDSIAEPIYSFNGSFSISHTFDPYGGYYFFNARNIPALKIPYAAQFQAAQSTAEPVTWKMGIAVSSREGTDSLLWLGVAGQNGNSVGAASLNYHKPNTVGSMPRSYFNRPDLDPEYHSFATDIRAQFDRVETWKFEVSGQPGTSLRLIFSGIDDVPSQFQVYLIDEKRAKYADLRKASSYSFTTAGGVSEFKVAVGTDDAVKEQLDRIPVPDRITLERNFPNPFNPSTSIPVGIPERSSIELKVFNILGEEIQTLYSGVIEKGRYWFTWDGKGRSGESLPSGVYVYRLSTGSGNDQAMSMILSR